MHMSILCQIRKQRCQTCPPCPPVSPSQLKMVRQDTGRNTSGNTEIRTCHLMTYHQAAEAKGIRMWKRLYMQMANQHTLLMMTSSLAERSKLKNWAAAEKVRSISTGQSGSTSIGIQMLICPAQGARTITKSVRGQTHTGSGIGIAASGIKKMIGVTDIGLAKARIGMRTEAEGTGMMMTGNIGAADSWRQCAHTLVWHLCQFRCITQGALYCHKHSLLTTLHLLTVNQVSEELCSRFYACLYQTKCCCMHLPVGGCAG